MITKPPMDFTGMRPSDALEKAHEAYPGIEWEWARGSLKEDKPCCCAAGLLCIATRTDWITLNQIFPRLPDPTVAAQITHDWVPRFWAQDMGPFSAAQWISHATINARSFPEAITLLRARGW